MTPTSQLTGDGSYLTLADGVRREIRFDIRAMMRIEDSGQDFVELLDTTPFSGLVAALMITQRAELKDDEDAAVHLLDGVDLPAARDLVVAAYTKANVFAQASEPADPPPAATGEA